MAASVGVVGRLDRKWLVLTVFWSCLIYKVFKRVPKAVSILWGNLGSNSFEIAVEGCTVFDSFLIIYLFHGGCAVM